MIDQTARDLGMELAPNEQLLWSGKPRRGILFRQSDWVQVPASIFVFGFSLFWIWGASQAPFPFWLFGVPLVAFGFYLLVGRFVYDAAVRDETSYGLTDQRILIVRNLFGRKVIALQVRLVPSITFAPFSDGSGTITFGSQPDSWQLFTNRNAPPAPPAFEAIPKAADVYQLVCQVQANELKIAGQ